jgi:ATP-binding cassette subfamily C protein CydD
MLPQDNQKAFDANQAKELHCKEWLNNKAVNVSRLIKRAALIGIIHGVLIILQSAVLAYIFQQLIVEKQTWLDLLNFFILLSIIFVARSISSYFFQTTGFNVTEKIKRSVRAELLSKLSSLGPAYTKQHQSGTLAVTTLEHVEALDGYFSRYLPQQIIVAVLPLLIIVAAAYINWVVAIIFVITGPLIPLFMVLVGMGATSAQREQFLVLGRMSGYFLNRLQGLSTIKLFGQANTELYTIRDVSNQFREKTMAVLRIAFLSSAVLEFFSAIAVALVAVYVGLGLLGLIHFGPADNISLQDALFVLLLAPEFFVPLKKLAAYYHDKAEAIAAMEPILNLLQVPSPIQTTYQSKQSKFCIELIDVSKSHLGKDVLSELNLQISAGEKIALVGESGVGKSTVFNLLLGFEQATSGLVLINGQTVTQQIASETISWAGQQASIFYASISDNISLLDPAISQEEINRAAEMAGVTDFSKKLKQGLLTVVGERGYGLSGGQIQRIALARAFVKNRPIILLDEPTAHLDQAKKMQLMNRVEQFYVDKTLIIATHDSQVEERMGRTINLGVGVK